MCESAAYVIRKNGEEKLLDDVTFLKPDRGRVFLRNLFGKELSIKGRIEEIRFMDHKIILVEDE
jgi:predicted RNA-binding protein